MSVHFFALSRRTKDKHDWIKFFDTFESQIMVFVNIFCDKNCSQEYVYLESIIL